MTTAGRAKATAVYEAVRRSGIFDRKLKMYKSCEDLRGESFELGRAVGAYPRGWIENESIYLHMEYKYLLEVIRSGLARRFTDDLPNVLIPFLDPAVYGRSILEGGVRRKVRVPRGGLACKLLGRTLVVYRNPGRRPTFGPRGVRPVAHVLHYRDGRRVRIEGPVVGPPHAEAVRAGRVETVNVLLGGAADEDA